MNGDYEPVDTYGAQPRRRSWLRALILPGVAFVLGLGAMGYVLGHWEAGARALGIAAEPVPVAADPAPAEPVAAAQIPPLTLLAPATSEEPQRIAIDPEITRRVAALEQRIGSVDTQSRAAVGNADRAEGLLVAFAARRALDRGVGLGFLETMLQQRFGQNQPNAVGRIIFAIMRGKSLDEGIDLTDVGIDRHVVFGQIAVDDVTGVEIEQIGRASCRERVSKQV